ncbi:hypothetical protein EXU57_16045 [Segetibacter sp. 3557_3]|uniref:Ig-like domain-containing protein n=1 Tax=Segetibacter sp. 3557_3 TaxID=2547429 RepID=UPI0010585B9C|nr:Ig-like domain-containing protein [Segetibacter sp. 3557_3]TDH24000.1 hypothetical protein EXU57_16045 [Segetibacter sp. 3557_3]
MKKLAPLFYSLLFACTGLLFLLSGTGCANIIPPGGGPRDSIPPVLVAATPPDSAFNVSTNRITFTFNEFVEVQNITENVLVSPTPTTPPFIDYKLRNVTVRLKDTLEPNTTYSINFGDAIRDVNEGNIVRNFTYVFSTGRTVDYNTFSGKVVLAETGRIDTTLLVVLHRNLDDSAVANEKPRYITRLDGQGNFVFRNLPTGTFAVYALPNEYSRRYDDKTKLFAFSDSAVVISDSTPPRVLYAYAETVKPPAASPAAGTRTAAGNQDKLLRYATSLESGKHDVNEPLRIDFNRKITMFDSTKVQLTNKDFQPVTNYTISRDTIPTRFFVRHPWPTNTEFNLLIQPDAFADSTGLKLAKNDTIDFATKKQEEYGSVKIRFTNLDFSRHPVLQIIENDVIILSDSITQRDWSRKLFKPGEYGLRILYDANRNGKWDAGEFFGVHRQPEIVRFIDAKLTVRANWDNEPEIRL